MEQYQKMKYYYKYQDYLDPQQFQKMLMLEQLKPELDLDQYYNQVKSLMKHKDYYDLLKYMCLTHLTLKCYFHNLIQFQYWMPF